MTTGDVIAVLIVAILVIVLLTVDTTPPIDFTP